MKRFNRTERVADEIQKSLANQLQQSLQDEKLPLITITGVHVSRDLSYAKVYVTVLTDEDSVIKETILFLNQSAKKIRSHLAKDLRLRIVPELKFFYDAATAHGFRITSLINLTERKSNSEKK